MQGDSSIKTLTRNGVQQLYDSKLKDKSIVLQIFDVSEARQNGNEGTICYKCQLSDGVAKARAYLFKEAAIEYQSGNIKERDIVIVLQYNMKEKQDKKQTFIVIQKLALVYDNVDQLIGEPMEYETYKEKDFTNPNGSGVIPSKVYSRNIRRLEEFIKAPSNMQGTVN